MEFLKEYMRSKCFSNFGYVVAVVHVPTLVIFVAYAGQLRTSERRTFRCDVPDCRHDCLEKYDEQYNSPLQLYAFALLCFVPSLVVCIAYSRCCVKSRVDEIEAAMKQDPENPRPRPKVKTRRVFCCYFLHLLVRFVLRISFVVLQNSVFYASNTFYASVFPAEFACYVCGSTAISKPTANSTNLNVTNIDPSAINCDNFVGSDNATWAKGIWIVNTLFAFLVFGELCYLLVRALTSNAFTFDSYFCLTHFFNERNVVTYCNWSSILLKSRSREEMKSLEPLNRALDNIFVDLKICIGRADYMFDYSLGRHKIYDIYLRPKQGSVPFEKLEELFLPNKDTENPRRILIVGRSGIGKSLLCKKMLCDWSRNELSFADSTKTFEHFFLIQFRWFNSGTEEKISLKQLLSRAHPDNEIDDDVFQDILDRPERVLLIFDGLNEFKHHDSCVKNEQAQGGDGPTEEINFSALYVKLVKGTQLFGATVVTTCRPNVIKSVASLNFDRTVEIMGFTPEKVQEYVQKFCAENTRVMNRIWMQLSSSLELLSLCYIPVISFIICSLLKMSITLEEKKKEKQTQQQDSESTLPTKTTTEVYERALELIIFTCHPEFREVTLTDLLMGNATFSDSIKEFLSRLGSLAKAGIEEGRLIVGSKEVQGMEDCGLLYCLPDSEVSPFCFAAHFCFIHLTIQELLAAREIAKKLPTDLSNFISSNAFDPKWQLVIQFVAGLLRHKEKNESVNSFVSHLHDALTAVEGKNKQTKQMALLMLKCLYEYKDDDVVKKAASELHRNSKFDNKIDLSQCQVTSVECIAITYFVKHLVEPTVLDLGGNRITDQGLSHLSETLQHASCKVIQLNLSGNSITDQGLSRLSETLQKASCKVTQLDLSSNSITDQGLFHLCETLLHPNCKVTQLGLGGNSITDRGLFRLCEALLHPNCKVTQLGLGGNSIIDRGLFSLCEALLHPNCKVTQLDLGGNSITDRGLSCLCETLLHPSCKVTQLGVSGTSITDRGLSCLNETLRQANCKVTQLDLGGNSITDRGLSCLCETLRHASCKVTQLDLSGNSITDEVLFRLCESLLHPSCKVTQLGLSGASITDRGLSCLNETLRQANCKVTQLDLSGNSIKDQGLLTFV